MKVIIPEGQSIRINRVTSGKKTGECFTKTIYFLKRDINFLFYLCEAI